MLLGLVLFRMMFQSFSEAEFGLWALLWSLFSYGILLDFGFGFTAQKSVSYFPDGGVIGSRVVNEVFLWARERFGAKRKDGARRMRRSGAAAKTLWSLRNLRVRV